MARIILHLHGKPSDNRFASLIEDYSQRLKSKVKIEIHSSKLSPEQYVSKLPEGSILLDEGGELHDSIQFSELFKQWQLFAKDVNLAIGPADGFPEGLQNQKISLSKLTFPHEFAAAILVEQLYRASEIMKGTSYHRV